MSVPLIVIGLDSADPDLLIELARDGHLPTLCSLMERGCHAKLTGPEMITAHSVWPSLFGGVSIVEHGRYLRMTLKPGTYELGSWDSNDKAPAFWSRLKGTGRNVAVVDAPNTDIVPGLDGVQVAGWGNHPTTGELSAEPPSFLGEVAEVAGARILTDEKQGSRARDVRIRDQILGRVAGKGRLCRHLLSSDSFDVFVVGFGDSHAAAHRFWRYRGDNGGRQSEVLATALRDIHAAIDREIGGILASAPSSANVVVVSNQGVSEGWPTWHFTDALLHELGYQVSKKPISIADRGLSFYAPTSTEGFRSFLSRRLPLNWRQRLDSEHFRRRTDWSRTQAFAIPAFYAGYVRVNLEGREPLGIVKPGAQYDELLERLEQDFKLLVDEDTGVAAVEKVHRTRDIFGDAALVTLPDLVVEWRDGAEPVRRLRHPKATIVRHSGGKPRWNHHSKTGFVAAAGPDLSTAGDLGELSPLDLTPVFEVLSGVTDRESSTADDGSARLLQAP